MEERESDLGIEEVKTAILNTILVENKKTNPKYTCMIKINTLFTKNTRF